MASFQGSASTKAEQRRNRAPVLHWVDGVLHSSPDGCTKRVRPACVSGMVAAAKIDKLQGVPDLRAA
jgi:hypothetical protein